MSPCCEKERTGDVKQQTDIHISFIILSSHTNSDSVTIGPGRGSEKGRV